jgi:hypothetical protein
VVENWQNISRPVPVSFSGLLRGDGGLVTARMGGWIQPKSKKQGNMLYHA